MRPSPCAASRSRAGSSGAEQQRQVAFCGAAPRDVRDLSVREIALLQTLEPPKDWTVAPGEQTTFLVVFVGPPPNLREFAAEVVAVQGQARRHGAADLTSPERRLQSPPRALL